MRIRIPKIRITKQSIERAAEVLARTSLPEAVFIATFVLSRYLSNIDFSYPSEVVIPIVLFGVLSAIVFYGFRMVFRRTLAAHIASLLLLYWLYSFQAILDERSGLALSLLPRHAETQFAISIVLVVVMVIVAGVCGFVITAVASAKQLRGFQAAKVLMFGILFVFVVQVGKVGIRLMQIYPELTYQNKPAVPAKKSDSAASSKPDIYYLVLDRYANANTLRDVYNYDNSAFLDYLNQQGFVTREHAYSNYPFTMSSISSTLAMGYHTELSRFQDDTFQTAFPYRDIINNPPVADVLKQEGYTYNQVSSWWDFTRLGVNADTNTTLSYRLSVFGAHFYLSDLTRDIFNKSVFSPLLKKGITVGRTPIIKYDLDRNPRQNFEAQVSTLKELSSAQHPAPQFTFAHILSPHDPYIFDASGVEADYDPGRNDNGMDEYAKYTKQLTYLNSRLEDLVTYMRQHSPNAVIIIQSDEGPYPKQFRSTLAPGRNYNPANLQPTEMKQKAGILASYYMPGVDTATVQSNVTASVNPFRFVLAHYLGYDMPMLPDCHFASGNKYNLYHYQLITDTLTGSPPDAACLKY